MISEQQDLHSKAEEKTTFFRPRLPHLLLFALLCQVLHFLLFPFPKRDPLTYMHIIRYWNETGSFAHVVEKFPKFGLMLYTMMPLKWADMAQIPLYPAAAVYMMLMSVVSVWAFYRIVRLLTGDETRAMWCGALLAVHPMILFYAGNLLRDTPYLMFSLLHILTFIEAVQKRKWYSFLLTGVTLALALLSRYEAWELLILSPVFAVFYMFKEKFSRREVLLWLLLAATGFAVIIAPAPALFNGPAFWFEKLQGMILSYCPEWTGLK